MKPNVWDMLVLAGFVSLVTGVSLYSKPLAAIVAGTLFMAAGLLGERSRQQHQAASDQAAPKG